MQSPYLVLDVDPLFGIMPQDIDPWLETHNRDADLAAAFAVVCNHVGRLGHDLEEGDPWLRYACEAWWSVEKHLYTLILDRMKQVPDSTKGMYPLVAPFMEANGYRDGHGWWVLKE